MTAGAMDLSIAICTYRNREFLRVCLASIAERVRRLRLEVIVVDNGSHDGTVEMVKHHFAGIRLVENTVNRGVARARNQAIRLARGRHVLLLDADTEFCSTDLDGLVTYLDAHEAIGIIGVRQLTFDDRQYPAARAFPKPWHIVLGRLAFCRRIRESGVLSAYHLPLATHTEPIDVDYVIGAFQLIRGDILRKIGLLDEKMFYGFEDADFCARAKKAGYRTVYIPAFTIRHYVQARTRRSLLTRTGLRLLLAHCRSYARFYQSHRDLLRHRRPSPPPLQRVA